MVGAFMYRFYTVPKREIVYLRFLVEGYDGLLFLRTLDSREGLVEFGYSPTMAEDAEYILDAIAKELFMVEAEPPPPGRYPFP